MTWNERTGWRDQQISGRHRHWGFNCPAVDLDFLMVEYNLGIGVALVEYKLHTVSDEYLTPQALRHPTYRALGGLYDERGKQLPLLIARYWPETWGMKVLPLNRTAKAWLPENFWTPMTERQFVQTLYKMRELAIDERVLRALNDHLPPDDEAVF